jgi:hypothetical protein
MQRIISPTHITIFFWSKMEVFRPSISHIGKITGIQSRPSDMDSSRNCICYYSKSTRDIHFYSFKKPSNTIQVLSKQGYSRSIIHQYPLTYNYRSNTHCKFNKLNNRECKLIKRKLPESPTTRTRTWPQGGPPFWSLFSLSRSLQNIVVMFFVLQNKSKSLLQNRTSKRSPIKHTQSQQRTTNSPNGYPQIQIHISSTFQAA